MTHLWHTGNITAADHEVFLSLGARSFVGSRCEGVDDGLTRCPVLWSVARSPSFLA